MATNDVMEITQSTCTHENTEKVVAAYRANPLCLSVRALPPVPGDPRLDGRPWRVVSCWPYDGRPAGVDGVVLLRGGWSGRRDSSDGNDV